MIDRVFDEGVKADRYVSTPKSIFGWCERSLFRKGWKPAKVAVQELSVVSLLWVILSWPWGGYCPSETDWKNYIMNAEQIGQSVLVRPLVLRLLPGLKKGFQLHPSSYLST